MMRSFTPMKGKKVACLIHCTCIPTKPICIHLIQKAHSPERNFKSISLLFFAKLFKMHKSKCMGKKAQLSENMGIATEMFDECHSQAIFCHLKCVVCPSVFFPLTDKQGLPIKKLNWQTGFTPNITDQPRSLNWPKSGELHSRICCYSLVPIRRHVPINNYASRH